MAVVLPGLTFAQLAGHGMGMAELSMAAMVYGHRPTHRLLRRCFQNHWL